MSTVVAISALGVNLPSAEHVYIAFFTSLFILQTRQFERETGMKSLSPHDALQHHFTSLETDPIFLQLTV